MTKHMTGHVKSGSQRGSSCSSGEGAHAAQRRAGAATAGAAVGPDRQGVPIRDRRGSASLADLFRGRSQLLVYHFMFGPTTRGVSVLLAIADGFNASPSTCQPRRHAFAVSRAPLTKLQAYKRRMGWTFPWASSFDGDFNRDFNVWFTEEQQREGVVEYNYGREAPLTREASGEGPVADFAARPEPDVATYMRERPA